jgi:hypothetical protein
VFSEYHAFASTTGIFMLRFGRWKYVHSPRAIADCARSAIRPKSRRAPSPTRPAASPNSAAPRPCVRWAATLHPRPGRSPAHLALSWRRRPAGEARLGRAAHTQTGNCEQGARASSRPTATSTSPSLEQSVPRLCWRSPGRSGCRSAPTSATSRVADARPSTDRRLAGPRRPPRPLDAAPLHGSLSPATCSSSKARREGSWLSPATAVCAPQHAPRLRQVSRPRGLLARRLQPATEKSHPGRFQSGRP